MAAFGIPLQKLRNEPTALVLILVLMLAGIWLDELRIRMRGDGEIANAVNINLNHANSPERKRFVDLLLSAGLDKSEANRVVRHAGESPVALRRNWLAVFSSPGKASLGFERVRELRLAPTLNPEQRRQLSTQSDSLPLDFSIPRRLDQYALRRILATAGLDSVWAYAVPDSQLALIHDTRRLHARLDGITLLPPGTAAHENDRGGLITTALMQRTSIDKISAALERSLHYHPLLAARVAREIMTRRLQDPGLRPAMLEHERALHPFKPPFFHRDLLAESKFDDVMAVLWPDTPPDSLRATAVNRVSAGELHRRLHIELPDAEALVARRSRIFFLGVADGNGVAAEHPEATLKRAPAVTPDLMARIENQIIVRPRSGERLWMLWLGYAMAWIALLGAMRSTGIPTRGAVAAMALASGLGVIAMNGYVDISQARDYATEFVWKHLVTSVAGSLALLLVLERGGRRATGRRGFHRGAGATLRLAHNVVLGVIKSPLLLATGVVLLCLLAKFRGHGAGDTKINLSLLPGVSLLPMKVCSSLAAMFAAIFILNNRSSMGNRFRHYQLVATALFFIVTGVAMAGLVGDFGTLLVVLLCWIGAYWAIVGRPASTGVQLVAIVALFKFGYEFVCRFPTLLPNTFYRVRWDMMAHPWNAGHPRSDQLAYALWAQAAGGWFGTQPGQEPTSNIPAGHTDMIISVIMQENGLLGLILLCAAFTAIFMVFFRRPEKDDDAHSTTDLALRIALGLPLFAETLLMLGGNLGCMPLTGLTLPFASFGHTGMLVNVCSVVLALWLGAPGRTTTIRTLDGPARWGNIDPDRMRLVWIVTAGLAVVCAVPLFWRSPDVILRHQLYVWGVDGQTQPPPLVERWLRRTARPGTMYDSRERFPLSVATLPADKEWNGVRDSLSGLQQRDAALLRAHGSDILGWIQMHPKQHRYYPLRAAGFAAVGSVDGALPALSPASRVRALLDGGGDSTARVQAYLGRWNRFSKKPGGNDVRLTIDAELQQRLYRRLAGTVTRPDQLAAAIVLDQDGRVCAAVSLPALDLNDQALVQRMRPEDQRPYSCNLALQDDPGKFWRPWAPGSVFKLVTLAGWLEKTDAKSTTSFCIEHQNAQSIRWDGGVIGAHRIHEPEHEGEGHGALELGSTADQKRALAQSCNVFFATMSAQEGAEALYQTATARLGLRLPDLPSAAATNARLAENGFGQGGTTLTPIELAHIGLTIANDGNWVPVRWLDGVRESPKKPGTPAMPWHAPSNPIEGDGHMAAPAPIGLDKNTARALHEAMRGVRLPGGTAVAAYNRSRLFRRNGDVYGKTGTAEMDGIGTDAAGRPYDGDIAWFVGVADWHDGRRHVCVVAVYDANGGGGKVAAPVVFETLEDAYELLERPRSLVGAPNGGTLPSGAKP